MTNPVATAFLRVSVRNIVLALALGWFATGCGFHLRGETELPTHMQVIYAEGLAPGSPFLASLEQNLKHSEGRLANRRNEAELILHAIHEQFDRREVSLSQTGKANSYGLTYELTYELQNPEGTVLAEPQTIKIVNEYFNPQVDVIGKSEEEAVIRKEMYEKAVRSFLSRVNVSLAALEAKPKPKKKAGKAANQGARNVSGK